MTRRGRAKSGRSAAEEALLAAVGAIYDAALAPELWPRALSQVSRACGSSWTICSITPLNPMSQGVSFQNAEADPDLMVKMVRYTTTDHNPSVPLLLAAPLGQIVRREAHFTDDEWERTELHNNLYRPHGIYSAMGIPLVRSRYFVPMGFHRNRSRGDFEHSHLAAIAHIVPHMQRAITLTLRLDTLTSHSTALECLWGRLAHGVFILDETGQILWVNRMGETIVEANDGLAIRDGKLLASAAKDNAMLHRLIAKAGSLGGGRGLDAGGVLAVSRPSLRRPLVAIVSPLDTARLLPVAAQRHPASAVVVSDPEAMPRTDPQLLIQLYHLTPREAALAALLLEGFDLREAGERLQLGMNTLRTHLRGIFDKTETSRQSELMSLLLRGVTMLRSKN